MWMWPLRLMQSIRIVGLKAQGHLPFLGITNCLSGGLLILALGGFYTVSGQNFDDLITPFEQDANYSASVEETHDWYLKLALQYPELVQTSLAGHSDGCRPLYEVIQIGRASLRERG